MQPLAEAVDPGQAYSPFDVCAFVDELGPEATGELTFEARGVTEGTVFVERGRVCWAAARGLELRLGDLLAASAGLDAADMEATYRMCKAQRVPLGEHLVRSQLVTPEVLRATLLRHTAESLRRLCDRARAAQWMARRRGGYSPRFTFSTPELLARASADRHGEAAEQATNELTAVLGEEDWGAAYVRDPASASPEPIAVGGQAPDRLEPVLRLAGWAASTLDVAGILGSGESFVTCARGGDALVTWTSGGVLFAARSSGLGPARMLNRRAAWRRRSA